MTGNRSEGPFRIGSGDPREEKGRRQLFASKLLARALVATGRYAARLAADLGVDEKKLRKMQDPSDPMTMSSRELVGLPEDMAVFFANEWMALHGKRVADLPIVEEEETASEFAREISQTSSGAINAILDEQSTREAKIKALRTGLEVYERATAQLLRAERDVRRMPEVKRGNRDGNN